MVNWIGNKCGPKMDNFAISPTNCGTLLIVIQVEAIAILFIILEAHRNTLFTTKVKIPFLFK